MRDKKDAHLHRDVSKLAKDAAIAEATEAVFDRLRKAMETLDPDCRELLEQYFNGVTSEELSRRCGIAKSEMDAWLTRSKRELMKGLRHQVTVRQ